MQAEEEYIRKAAAKGVILNHTDDLFIPINNRPIDEDEVDETGLDAAVDALSEAVKGKASVDEHPERRRKVRICCHRLTMVCETVVSLTYFEVHTICLAAQQYFA